MKDNINYLRYKCFPKTDSNNITKSSDRKGGQDIVCVIFSSRLSFSNPSNPFIVTNESLEKTLLKRFFEKKNDIISMSFQKLMLLET